MRQSIILNLNLLRLGKASKQKTLNALTPSPWGQGVQCFRTTKSGSYSLVIPDIAKNLRHQAYPPVWTAGVRAKF